MRPSGRPLRSPEGSLTSMHLVACLYAEAYRLLEAGQFTPVVAARYTLESASQAHIDVITPAKGGACGNLIVTP